MANTLITYVSDGVQTIYTFPFDYLRTDFVAVSVEGQPVGFSLSNTYEITLDAAPTAGDVIIIKRVTDTETLVDFVDGSVLVANDLNVSALQSLHIAAEALDAAGSSLVLAEDGSYSAGFRRVGDVGDPTNDRDAVNKQWAETAMTSQLAIATAKAAEALASQVASSASQVAAAGSASAASTSETNAAASASAASTSETNAAASASAAASAQSDVAAKYADFDSKYLGHKASDPTLDNQGGALVNGQLYYNTSNDLMMVYVTGHATAADGWYWIGADPGINVLASSVLFDPTYNDTAETDLQLLLQGILDGTALNDGAITPDKLDRTYVTDLTVESVQIVDSGTGWVVVGDRLIQWGQYTSTHVTNGIILPVAFKDTSYVVTANIAAAAPPGAIYAVYPAIVSTVQFNLSTHHTLNVAGGGGVSMYWLAVGPAPDASQLPKQLDVLVGTTHQEYHDPTGVASWKITGNTLECWGKAAGNGHRDVSFPKTFARAPTVVASVDNNTEQVDTTLFITSVYARTTTGFGCKAQFATTGSVGGTSADVSWHAIGEWDGVS